ncbi:MAG TPA: CDP-diacylglycerol--glycerol-3-phosphate 3-phosphatidyltransferase, partial [Chromatiaceae bacterium]|nr:CDP-diacylglycerol--glycerol-3-phosphate 3-phosphatidyltransferase [Chromatiaceae bacterium]
MWNIPNILTLLRILLIPVFVIIFYLPFPWVRPVCALVFTVAALTDWLDGWLARRLNQTSPLGAFLDPVADKLMVAIALVLLVQSDPRMVLALPAAVIIGREITVSALREWMAEIGARAQVAVSMAGKLKTTAQMVSIVLLILHHPVIGIPVLPIGLALIYVAAALTL